MTIVDAQTQKSKVIAVLFGSTGVGKSAIMDAVLEKKNWRRLITATERPKRDYEVDEVDYYFKTKEEFDQMIKNDEFFETATYNGNRYGLPKFSLEAAFLDVEHDHVVSLEIEGCTTLQQLYKERVCICQVVADRDLILSRLSGRGYDDRSRWFEELSLSQIERLRGGLQTDVTVINNLTLENAVEDFETQVKGYFGREA